jgi:hypothetical protein
MVPHELPWSSAIFFFSRAGNFKLNCKEQNLLTQCWVHISTVQLHGIKINGASSSRFLALGGLGRNQTRMVVWLSMGDFREALWGISWGDRNCSKLTSRLRAIPIARRQWHSPYYWTTHQLILGTADNDRDLNTESDLSGPVQSDSEKYQPSGYELPKEAPPSLIPGAEISWGGQNHPVSWSRSHVSKL